MDGVKYERKFVSNREDEWFKVSVSANRGYALGAEPYFSGRSLVRTLHHFLKYF